MHRTGLHLGSASSLLKSGKSILTFCNFHNATWQQNFLFLKVTNGNRTEAKQFYV